MENIELSSNSPTTTNRNRDSLKVKVREQSNVVNGHMLKLAKTVCVLRQTYRRTSTAAVVACCLGRKEEKEGEGERFREDLANRRRRTVRGMNQLQGLLRHTGPCGPMHANGPLGLSPTKKGDDG